MGRDGRFRDGRSILCAAICILARCRISAADVFTDMPIEREFDIVIHATTVLTNLGGWSAGPWRLFHWVLVGVTAQTS